MGHTHLSDDDLIDRLYGFGRADAWDKQDGCRECEERWRRVKERRQRVIEAPEVSPFVLALERREILDRIEGRTAPGVRRRILAPVAVAAMIAVSVGLEMPAPKPEPTIARAQQMSDQALFEQVFTDVTRTEPQSLAAVRSLFEGER
jgi:hypothetical protein